MDAGCGPALIGSFVSLDFVYDGLAISVHFGLWRVTGRDSPMVGQPVRQLCCDREERQSIEIEVAGAGRHPPREVWPNRQKSHHFFLLLRHDRTVWSILTYARKGIKSIATERFSHQIVGEGRRKCRSRQLARLRRWKVPSGAKFSMAPVLCFLLRASTPRAWAKSL